MPARTQHLISAFSAALVVFASACALDQPDDPEAHLGGATGVPNAAIGDRIGTTEGEPGWTPLMPGASCAEHVDCDSVEGAGDGYCYVGDVGGSMVFPDTGYCTVDNGLGTVCELDEDCPGDSVCADADGYRLCLPACGVGDVCPAGQVCLDSFGGQPILTFACLPGNGGAVDGDACASVADCGPSSTCWNDAEHPGGMCSAYACTLGTNDGCNGGVCIEFEEGPSTGTVCVAACTVDADCRDGEGYVCHDPDGAGAAAAYCRHPHAGDACAADTDCSDGWTCLTTAGYTDGYCSITACPTPGATSGCGSGAICGTVDTVNTCLDRCPTIGVSDTCRTGYVCTDVGAVNGGACLPIPEPE